MGVKIKQTVDEVFKLFTDIHFSEGSIPSLSFGKDFFYSGTNPLGSERRENSGLCSSRFSLRHYIHGKLTCLSIGTQSRKIIRGNRNILLEK